LRYPTHVAATPLPSYIDWLRLSSVVTLSCGPSLSLPCGLTRDGRPVGLQMIV
ncbi:amidase, partial [Nannochloropsis gaditana CCMP526]|uniref:amidase n=1 Tax=Nannochloropsis gaditana (strain CCMP526) TaxID=1093141 RepID=UPI00029F5C72